MNRALFSGVSGLKAHQTKMDVIGNNISNVNTYGYKSQRVVFSDVFYQTVSSATEGTTSKGGTNPSSIGYGSKLAAIQTDMSQSSLQSTSYGLDVAITGEGFFQVMDGDGNIFYTKAGILDYDANGYLTDVNGNFVLGASDSDSDPASNKIKLDDIGSVAASQASAEVTANGIEYTIKSTNSTDNANISISLGSGSLASGLRAKATISTTGAVNVVLNSTEEFSSISDLQNAINEAIKEANGGEALSAGDLIITAPDAAAKFTAAGGTLTGAEICGSDFSVDDGTITGDDMYGGSIALVGTSSGFLGSGVVANGQGTLEGDDMYGGAITFAGTSSGFTGSGAVTNSDGSLEGASIYGGKISVDSTSAGFTGSGTVSRDSTATPATNNFTATYDGTSSFLVTMNVADSEGNTSVYQGTVSSGDTGTTLTLKLFDGTDYSDTDYVDLTILTGTGTLDDLYNDLYADAEANDTAANGGDDSGTINGDEGIIPLLSDTTSLTATPPEDDFTATYDDANSCFTISMNIGGTTYEGTVDATSGTTLTLYNSDTDYLELTIPDDLYQTLFDQADAADGDDNESIASGYETVSLLASGDSLSATTPENSFTAEYNDSDSSFTISMDIGGRIYQGTLDKDETATSMLLKYYDGTDYDDTDYMEISIPSYSSLLSDADTDGDGSIDTAAGEGSVALLDAGDSITVTPATESNDLGLASTSFNLTGGTEGGAVTLDQLSSIAIGSDGVITVTQSDLGTVVAGKISLANFANPSGLELQGSDYYTATTNSGDPVLCDPGSDGTGELESNTLELSNVDLSSEFADMITTQRGFQANSRIITVSDTMLEELINLKR